MTLLELLQLLRKRLALVIALPLIAAIVVAAYSWLVLPDKYTAETSLYVLTQSDSQQSQVNSSDLVSSQYLANDFAQLAKNDQITDRIAASIGMNDLSGYQISVSNSSTTRVIILSVTGENPDSAALIANKMAKEMGDLAKEVMGVEAVNVVNEATAPSTPSGPNRLMYTTVALLAGLFVAIALVILLDMLNTTVRTEEDITQKLGLPIVGRFADQKGGRR